MEQILNSTSTTLTSTPKQAAIPTKLSLRIEAMDVLRGFALFGILLMNIATFGLPSAYSDPTVYGGSTGASLNAWVTIQMFFEGTQRGLFSILFGAGVILLTSRLEASGREDVADIYFRRNLWLVLFGIIHCFILLWLGEILFFYGVVALFLYSFRNLAAKHLLMIGLAGLLFNGVWTLGETLGKLDLSAKAAQAEQLITAGETPSSKLAEANKSWEAYVAKKKPNAEKLQKDVDAHQGSYLTILTFQAPQGVETESMVLYRYFFDFFSMMVIGMALFKLGVLTLERKTSTYLTMVGVGYCIGILTNYFETTWIMQHDFSVEARLQASVTYDLGRLAMTLGHIGLLLLFVRSGFCSWLRNSMAAVGRMALTNYVSHSVICAFVFYGFGFGLYGQLQRYELYYVVFGICLFQLIFSPVWLARFHFGPLEWAWRALTYLHLPNLVKRAKSVPSIIDIKSKTT
jgi:uncharacterized protein